MRRKQSEPELKPVYVRPQLDKWQRAACRAFVRAAYRGKRNCPKAGDFDPLHLRMGMLANCIEQRAGWVVSNPLYDQTLRQHPDIDPSLPGPGWLRELYHSRHSDLVLLQSSRAARLARMEALRACEYRPAPAADQPHQAEQAEAKLDLFA